MSGKLPGGLWYVRATLPPTVESSNWRGGKGRRGDGGGSDGEGDGESDTEEGRGGGGSGDAAKSFTTGAIDVGGQGKDEEAKHNTADADAGVTGDYCLVRVDSLDRVCDVVYCGRGEVEAKNLSKVVGMQLGYLQVSGLTRSIERPALLRQRRCRNRRWCVEHGYFVVFVFAAPLFLSSVPAPCVFYHSQNRRG